MSTELKRTVLYARHQQDGARFTPFAGYEMPVQFRDGVLAEHRWTRASAGLFDVSHMGPFRIALNHPTGDADADHARLAACVEPILSADVAGLGPGRVRYALLLNETGGLLDDLMIARPPPETADVGLYIVVNGATKAADLALFVEAAGEVARIERLDDGGLIALQGPEAAAVLSALAPETAGMGFMDFAVVRRKDAQLFVSRSGYTGEDGFEVLVPASAAEAFYEALLADHRVRPAGLGARDSLRLEAGLPLYGHDADPTTSPFEAALGFAVSKRRLRTGDLRGAARFAAEAAGELKRVRIGLLVLEGAPAREGAAILDEDGAEVGVVTSGGFSPTLGAPIAMGFAPPRLAAPGAPLKVVVRGKAQPARVAPLPFVPHRYVRKS